VNFFLDHSEQPWAVYLFRFLWVLLFVFAAWASFTIGSIARSCFEISRLFPTISFFPSLLLGFVALAFAVRSLVLLAVVAAWRIGAEIHRRETLFDQHESLKRELSIQDRSSRSD
jgi:hypothetical protein